MIKGYGWIKDGLCGAREKGLQWQYADQRSLCGQLLKDKVLSYPIENFGRFNQDSRFTCLAIALALHDGGIVYSKDKKQEIGIIGTSQDGALSANLEYFRDYVKAGRKLGRGNLFIYTLPSSPIAEAAIHFGLSGPSAYMGYTRESEENLLAQAELMIKNKDAQAMLAVVLDDNSARCYYVSGVDSP